MTWSGGSPPADGGADDCGNGGLQSAPAWSCFDRCGGCVNSTACVLGCVVQPRDIVPDDAPGDYGFVDDNALLVLDDQLYIPS